MKRIQGLQNLTGHGGCVLSIGNFDGVHRGHQAILSTLKDHARRLAVPAIVLTFEPHPATLLKPGYSPPRLSTPARKAELISELGVDVVLEYETDWALLNLSPREFFDEMILGTLHAMGLVEGPNFYFGKGRAGNVQVLEEFCRTAGCFLEVVPPTLAGETIVSSSLIRQLLSEGAVEQAAHLLGRYYETSGIVRVGAQRGRTLGFPTANLEEIETILPADGVYAAWARVQGRESPAAVSIGPNLTFDDGRRKVEAHLLQSSGDFYQAEMTLRFVKRIRGLQKFGSVNELQSQINEDIKSIQTALNAH